MSINVNGVPYRGCTSPAQPVRSERPMVVNCEPYDPRAGRRPLGLP